MHRLILIACLLLAACATQPPPAAPADLFDDAAFAAPSTRIDARAVMAISPPMKRYLDEVIAPRVRPFDRSAGLVDALYTRGELKLLYDTETTRSASEAFDARAGNCLSLVLMTAAFARELGIPVRFQSVPVESSLGRDGDLLLFVGHVNIGLGRVSSLQLATGPVDWVTVDFLPGVDLARQRAVPIEQSTVLAMYMNNKAAEALGRGRLDDAYAWAREAITQDRTFAAAYNTLGVVYLRAARPAHAERALRHALALDADNPHSLSNLVLALRGQGRQTEATVVAERLKRIQPTTPFAFFELGQQAMREGDWQLARRQFEQAVRRDGEYHEFHFALAQALIKLGEFDRAARELERAREASATQRLQSLYAGKLERLRGQRSN